MIQIRFSTRQMFVAIVCLGIAAVLFFAAQKVNAQGPLPGGKRAPNAPAGTLGFLTYQGRLTNSSGVPINSTVNVVFKMYDSSSALLWTSATRNITPVNGLFTVYLGGGSDPNLVDTILESVASIGVTVGSDSEMAPRQVLNTIVGSSLNSIGVVGNSVNWDGVAGKSVNGDGVVGTSTNSIGVAASTYTSTAAALTAYNDFQEGPALSIANGSFQVYGAGIGASTPAFVHVTSAGTITGTYETIVSHLLTNGDPNAILIVTPTYNYGNAGGNNDAHPVGVYWRSDIGQWVIYNIDHVAMPVGVQFNVLVIKP